VDWIKDFLRPELIWFLVGLVLLIMEFMLPGLIIFFPYGLMPAAKRPELQKQSALPAAVSRRKSRRPIFCCMLTSCFLNCNMSGFFENPVRVSLAHYNPKNN